MDFVPVRIAAILGISMLGAVAIFHMLVIVGIVPKTIVWGGRISDPARVVKMEIGSVVIVLFAAAVLALRWWNIASGNASLAWTIGTWALVGLFALNTVGNLFAKTTFERAVMTPLTLILALIALRLALAKVG